MSLRNKTERAFFIVAPVAFALAFGGIIYSDRETQKERKTSEPLIAQAYQSAAGKDRLLSSKEASQLIRDLNITGAIGEHEMLRMGPWGSEIRVYAQGPGGRHNTERNIGYVSRSNLLEYIERHKQGETK